MDVFFLSSEIDAGEYEKQDIYFYWPKHGVIWYPHWPILSDYFPPVSIELSPTDHLLKECINAMKAMNHCIYYVHEIKAMNRIYYVLEIKAMNLIYYVHEIKAMNHCIYYVRLYFSKDMPGGVWSLWHCDMYSQVGV